VNYQSIGSGGGITQVTKGLVDFGASDMPMTDAALSASPIKLIHIPTVLGAVVPIFNVPGIQELKFSPDVLGDIYLGKIVNWNDARIAKDNAGAKLPDQLYLYRLPEQGEQRMERRPRQGQLSELAGRRGRQGQ